MCSITCWIFSHHFRITPCIHICIIKCIYNVWYTMHIQCIYNVWQYVISNAYTFPNHPTHSYMYYQTHICVHQQYTISMHQIISTSNIHINECLHPYVCDFVSVYDLWKKHWIELLKFCTCVIWVVYRRRFSNGDNPPLIWKRKTIIFFRWFHIYFLKEFLETPRYLLWYGNSLPETRFESHS